MRDNEELMRNLKISDNSGHLVPYSARKPLGPILLNNNTHNNMPDEWVLNRPRLILIEQQTISILF